MDNGVLCLSHRHGLCWCWLSLSALSPRELCDLGWAIYTPLDMEGKEQRAQGRTAGEWGWWRPNWLGRKLARLRLNSGGRAGQGGQGWTRTAGSCQTHNLILRLYSLCLGDFQLAIVSFTDGFAAANYKFVSNSFSDALKKKKPYPSANYKFITNSVIQLNAKQIHYQLHYSIEYQVNELHRVLCISGTCWEMGMKEHSPSTGLSFLSFQATSSWPRRWAELDRCTLLELKGHSQLWWRWWRWWWWWCWWCTKTNDHTVIMRVPLIWLLGLLWCHLKTPSCEGLHA